MGIRGVTVLQRPGKFACAVALGTYMQVSNMSTTIRTGYTPRLATIEHLGRDCSCNKNENAGEVCTRTLEVTTTSTRSIKLEDLTRAESACQDAAQCIYCNRLH